LNKIVSNFESNEEQLLINTSNHTGSTSDLVYGFDNGKSDDWRQRNDSANEVSGQPNDDKKSMRTVAHERMESHCSSLWPILIARALFADEVNSHG
jgi:hypothetical protein